MSIVEKVIRKGKLSEFKRRQKKAKRGGDLITPKERMLAMSVICKSRTEDGPVERRFFRIRKAS